MSIEVLSTSPVFQGSSQVAAPVSGKRFDVYMPRRGKYAVPRLDIETQLFADSLRRHVLHSGWHFRTQAVALAIIEVMTDKGIRFEVDVVKMATVLEVKIGVVYYHLRKLRALGFLWGQPDPRKKDRLLPRRKSTAYSYVDVRGKPRWWAERSVHQLSQRLRRWLEDISAGHSDISKPSLGEPPGGEPLKEGF